mmetsp:Transcript_12885/g.17800  ORF Transcript_12885/g.17800 Transcript_12885/m.17800 type:complete len:171 (+) Transcript_12885:65-577(+)
MASFGGSSSQDPYDRYGERRSEGFYNTPLHLPKSIEGIKIGEKRETPRAFYIGAGVLGLGALTFGLLARRVVSGVSSAASASAKQSRSDAAGRGFLGFQRYYYEGGFADEMTKREAAQILGCRESANKDVIMKKYRSLMKSNHPDLGGSRFIGTKINQAKELLTKTARTG